MFLFAISFWVSLWSYIVQVFGFICRNSLSSSSENLAEIESDFDGENENENPKLDSDVGNVCNASTSKYEFISGNSLCTFIEEPQIMSFTVQEIFAISNDDSSKREDFLEDHASSENNSQEFRFRVDPIDVSNPNSLEHGDCGELSGLVDIKHGETVSFPKHELCEKGEVSNVEGRVVNEKGFHVNSIDVLNPNSLEHGDCCEFNGVVDIRHGEIVGVPEHELCEEGEVSNVEDRVVNEKGFHVDSTDVSSPNSLEHGDCCEFNGVVDIKHGETVSFDEHELCEKGKVSNVENIVVNEKGFNVDSIDDPNPNSLDHGDCGELNALVDIKQGETVSFDEHELCEKGEVSNVEERVLKENGNSDEVRLSLVSNSDDFWSSIHTFDGFSDSNLDCDSDTDEMISYKSLVEALEPESPMGIGDKRVNYGEDSPSSLDDYPLVHSNSLHLGSVEVESEQETVDSVGSDKFLVHSEEHISEDEFSDSDDELEEENSDVDDSKGIDASESCDGDDDQTETDALMEQKELIRRMKKEMRHLKISGLPTILEESESPRVEDDLRPLKINERIGHKDRMDEIQILYRKYLDKMRKLDILSQQSMYAIGLLQLKSQDQLASSKKVSVPVIKSLLAQNFWSNKFRKHEADPVQKLIRDFQRDLELVYVGQVCLSWELLKWQHHKSEELHANDPDGFRQHNQVAGDFQKFQVLLQRFTEDEPFHHGPRVQHYVKSRCSQPNLLQVPLIKDDPSGEWRGKGEGGISIGMLKEVIGASMRAFWEFLHADKEEVHATSLIGIHGVQVELQDPSDTELLTDVRSSLQKKEKRLKDLVRSGNCIVRKFQKHRDQRLSHEMFLAQVELRLISRVLTMSRLTTDQLLWCHKKMSKINIVGRKVHLDHSILLFPC